MVRSRHCILYVVVITAFLCGCSKDDNAVEEPSIVFNPNSDWSYEIKVAIDTTTFSFPPYKLRIPFSEVTNAGTIIVGTDIREGTTSDQTKISIGIVRSENGGQLL